MKKRPAPTVLAFVVIVAAGLGPVWAQNEGSGIPGEGHQLPMKWGIGMTLYHQTQPYDIVSLEIPLAGLDIGAAEGLEIESRTDSYHLKFDYWLFPFLNVFLLGGHIEGDTTVMLSNVELGLPITLNNIKIDYSGVMYGGGATLAVGGKGWFTSLTYDITRTNLDVASSTVSAWVLTPRFGLTFKGAAVWVGAMYQNAEETHQGVWEMPYLGAVPYSAVLEQSDPWNYQIGMIAGIGEHWNLTFEGGVGNRKSVLANLEYRFGKR